MLAQELADLGVSGLHDPPHLLVDESLRGIRGLRSSREERADSVHRNHRDRSDSAAHTPASHHLAGDAGQVLDVRLGAGGDVAEHDLLRRPAAERDLDLNDQVVLVEIEAIGIGR